jgi:hypothetical protein
LYAAKLANDSGHIYVAAGFFTVALAAFVGVLRFGFSESIFANANSHLADVAAFVGLPLVGLTFMHADLAGKYIPWNYCGSINPVQFTLILVLLETISRSFNKKLRELSKIVANLIGFVGPVVVSAVMRNDYNTLFAILLFVVAGLVITPDRHRCILGVRCENWFHYCIGISAVVIAKGLK